jgi:tetratricopeptide (TPR) repeat protein
MNRARNYADIRQAARKLRLVLLVSIVLISHTAPAQGQAGGHTLFGDLKVDETKVNGVVPLSFDVVLYTEGGVLLGRQTVVNNSRYRFLNLQDGRYDVVVEVEGPEVARVRVLVQAAYKTDFRQDIHLEWKEGVSQRQRTRAQTISATDFYDRAGRNKSLFERAQRLLDKRQYREAASLLNEIVAIDPADFQAWTELGTAHLAVGDAAEAEKAYRRAIQERPTFALALLNLGRLLITQKRYTESIDALTRAIDVRPDSADSHFLLGETYLKLKLGSKAVPHLNEALRLDPIGKADAHLLLAALYDGAGLKDRAASEYEQFLAKRQNYSDRKKLERYISEHKKTSRVAAPED